MAVHYPVLEGEIAKRGIKKQVIAQRIGVSRRTLMYKLSGESDFNWNEVCIMQSVFFPDMDKDTLMRSNSDN